MPVLQIGDIILNTYQIERLLGQGSFGEVYLARHINLKVLRALKVLRHDVAGVGSTIYSDFRERFQQEARLGAEVEDEHLIKVHDYQEEKEADRLTLVMEYAAGGSLADRLAGIKTNAQLMDVEEGLKIVLDVAEGLAALHEKDIVHRDLKGRATVADLGLTQIPGGLSSRSRLDSQAKQHPGTPAYMSPEQAATLDYLTSASDVYALGLILFEMLTGRAYKNMRPGTRLSKVRKDTPEWLDELINQMLSDDVKQRPWDGAEVVEILKNKLNLNPAAAPLDIKEPAPKPQARVEPVINESNPPMVKPDPREESRRKIPGYVWEENGRRFASLGSGVWMEFVCVPAGKFLMGSDLKKDPDADGDELPGHKVYLSEYWIGRSPVTNIQYLKYLEAAHHACPEHWKKGEIPPGREAHPVINVNWMDANDFCTWLGREIKKQGHSMTLRLPSEAEWEKAARGTEGWIYPWGDQAPKPGLCNYKESKLGETSAVGSFSPQGDSPYGCVDMVGNVTNWVADWYSPDYFLVSPEFNPPGPDSGESRVRCGGSWFNDGRGMRAANRMGNAPGSKSKDIGFRCAISA